MSRRAIITGAAGQDGVLLANLLIEKNYEVYGITRAFTAAVDQASEVFGAQRKAGWIAAGVLHSVRELV